MLPKSNEGLENPSAEGKESHQAHGKTHATAILQDQPDGLPQLSSPTWSWASVLTTAPVPLLCPLHAPPDFQCLPLLSFPALQGPSPISLFSIDHEGFLGEGMSGPVIANTKVSQESRAGKCRTGGTSPGALGTRCLAASYPKLVLAGNRGVGLWGAETAAAASH